MKKIIASIALAALFTSACAKKEAGKILHIGAVAVAGSSDPNNLSSMYDLDLANLVSTDTLAQRRGIGVRRRRGDGLEHPGRSENVAGGVASPCHASPASSPSMSRTEIDVFVNTQISPAMRRASRHRAAGARSVWAARARAAASA